MKCFIIKVAGYIREKIVTFFTIARLNTLSGMLEKTALGLGLGMIFKPVHDIDSYLIAIILITAILSVVLSVDKEDKK